MRAAQASPNWLFYTTNLSNYNIFQIFIIKLAVVSSNMEIKGQKVKRLTRKKYDKMSFLLQIKFITDDLFKNLQTLQLN